MLKQGRKVRRGTQTSLGAQVRQPYKGDTGAKFEGWVGLGQAPGRKSLPDGRKLLLSGRMQLNKGSCLRCDGDTTEASHEGTHFHLFPPLCPGPVPWA